MLTALQGIALLVLLILLPYFLMFCSRRARLVASIPGPTPLPFIGNGLEGGMTGVDFLKNIIRFREKYGSIFRIWYGPYLLMAIADPQHAEIFLTSKTNIKKAMHYRLLESMMGLGLMTSAGDKWRSDRKLLNPAFNYKILEEFVSIFNSHASILAQKLRNKVGSSEFDIHKYSSICALDIICETSMGVRMHFQDNKNSEYLDAFTKMEDSIIKRAIRPWLFPDFIFKLSELGKQQKSLLKILHTTSKKIIDSKKSELLLEGNKSEKVLEENEFGIKKRSPFLDLLLQCQRDRILTDQDVQAQVDTFLMAGHDTFAATTSFCLWLLAKHPQYQEKAYEEMNTIFGDSDRDATAEDLQNMKYLETIIKETLRLYPSAPGFLRELEEEVKFDGCRLLPGTTVAIVPYLVHRHPDYFPEPEKFDPDRFSPERAKGRHPYAFIPFSAGPRNCIGQRYAMMGVKCVISRILRSYKLFPGTKELLLSYDISLKSVTGIHIKLDNRKPALT